MGSDYKTYDDRELLRLLSTDSEPALKELYERYWESLFTKAYNFLRSEDGAKDCVQEVFVWLWQHRKTVAIENLDHYLRQAVRFQALRAIRERKAAHDFEDRLVQFTKNVVQEDTVAYNELKNIFHRLIASLPEDQRLIFRLHREEALTYREISTKLGISVKTVEKKMSKSLRHIRLNLDKVLIPLLFCNFLP